LSHSVELSGDVVLSTSVLARLPRLYSPRCLRADIADSASRVAVRSRKVWRLSYSRLPLATAISTFARPSLK
jgi:hypothetical protein